MGTKKGIVLGLFMSLTACGGLALAETSYLVYPGSAAVFRFDPARYELVSPGSPRFDPSFAIGGEMLWDRVEQRIPVELYRAPSITGFEVSPTGHNEFVVFGGDFDVIIDGFGTAPRTLGNLCLRFWPEPLSSFVQVSVNGVLLTSLTTGLSPIEVNTPVGDGYYADTGVYRITWVGASGLEVVAFSDKDADGVFDGLPAYRILARDSAVATESSTWGAVKALYRD